jgi:hypothetical protein
MWLRRISSRKPYQSSRRKSSMFGTTENAGCAQYQAISLHIWLVTKVYSFSAQSTTFFFLPLCSHFWSLGLISQFLDHSQTLGLLARMISSSQGLYLNIGQQKHRKTHTHIKHPCSEWDSNRRSRLPSERRQYMPQTARLPWPALRVQVSIENRTHGSVGILDGGIYDAKIHRFIGFSAALYSIKLRFYKYGILRKFSCMSCLPGNTKPSHYFRGTWRICVGHTNIYRVCSRLLPSFSNIVTER